ncbi:uncharacterized protein PFL1_00945 [Pseudozyma flocculosa PF-1]|uniref:Related to Putative transferase CAF17, mitochondrial n=1 Tax=Pseudozyma flocculosa TaxID=84751 RepID=A0A5C3F9G2_9BASI|nr:uncharacterized protein PFL1_00945 [Pseudozyma flocculosa PF-1]EPQ31612.1 hypothetical protein PFL1_00945 [Pseudozyma flocculosa PF-1]SPO40726.1 related to Putative transferase CAF17, mitochondrial [Pseudozyma flocculosa]
MASLSSTSMQALRLPCRLTPSFEPRSRLYSTAPAGSASLKVATVPDRGVIEVKGRDTVKLIQGLVSNDVRKLERGDVDLMLACFANAQGRMLADVLIHRLPPAEDGTPRWLFDTDARTMPSLLSFIKKFKLRSKVTLKDVSDQWSVVQLWSGAGSATPPAELLGSSEDRVVSLDPRAPDMGYRAVVRNGQDRLSALSGAAAEVDGSEYTVHRIVQGVAEGAIDFPEASSVPLENNIDYMNGVDFRKGCYVGQELTARTHHTGVVRKRIVPISFYLPGTPAPTSLAVDPSFTTKLPPALAEVRSKPITPPPPPSQANGQGGTDGGDAAAPKKPTRGRSAGKFTTGIYNLGLGCLRLEQVARWQDPTTAQRDGLGDDAVHFTCENEEGQTILVKPWIPHWWPEAPRRASEGQERTSREG